MSNNKSTNSVYSWANRSGQKPVSYIKSKTPVSKNLPQSVRPESKSKNKNIFTNIDHDVNLSEFNNMNSAKIIRHQDSKHQDNDTDTDFIDSSYARNVNLDDEDLDTEERKANEIFNESVVKFVTLDDKIREREKEIRELKSLRKPFEAHILKCLEELDQNIIEITNGKLRKNKAETKSPLTRDIIRNAIEESIQDKEEVDKIITRMDEMRPNNVRINLKRTLSRVNK